MTRFYVHYEVMIIPGSIETRVAGAPGQIARMIAPIEAKSEQDAIAQCKAKRPGSFGHWVKQQKSRWYNESR